MSAKNWFIVIINWICVALFLAAGIVVLILKHNAAEVYDGIILGAVLIVGGSVKILVYLFSKCYKEPIDISAVVGIVMVALGFVFMFSRYDIETLCFGWGILEVIASGIEIHQNALRVKKHRLAIVEIVISVGCLVFAIILCIKNTEALNEHLIFMGISLILLAINQTIAAVTETRSRRKK